MLDEKDFIQCNKHLFGIIPKAIEIPYYTILQCGYHTCYPASICDVNNIDESDSR